MAQQDDQQDNRRPSNLMRYIIFGFALIYLLYGNFNAPHPNDGQSSIKNNTLLNMYSEGQKLDIYVYISRSKDNIFPSINGNFHFITKEIIYNNWDSNNYRYGKIELYDIPFNSTLYANIFVIEHGLNFDDAISLNDPFRIQFRQHPLTKTVLHKVDNRINLLSFEELNDEDSEKVKEPQYINHWKGNLTISILQDMTPQRLELLEPIIRQHFHKVDDSHYCPPIYGNDFWILKENLVPLNETLQNITLDISFEPLSLIKFSLYEQIQASLTMQSQIYGKDGEEGDEFKRILIDNPPWLLGLTFAISLIHTLLDILAFKNEVQFWRSRKSMEGLSLKTVYINIISNLIVFLYLIDNDASWMVLLSVGLGLLIEIWKITKAADVTIEWKGSIPILKIKDKQSYKATKKFDDEAMKYLYYILYPLVIGYAIYSLIYETHKSWYSWIISSLAGCVYTFGFIMMTPQLFINYRMKSVSHLPWRTFVYKAINTFIDDLFAFIIRMPTMHRLRCFRDDIIFLIYLYQRWIYPVDKKRVESIGGNLGETIDNIDESIEDKEESDKKND